MSYKNGYVFFYSVFLPLGLTALVAKFTVPEFEGAHRRITSGLALNYQIICDNL